jgi:NADPH:quinone reductase-like Zn-dependent oxidoreductase
VILDHLGASYLPRNVDLLATDGRLVVIGLQGGAKGELDLGALLVKRASVSATSLRPRPLGQKAEICTAVATQAWPLVEAGAIVPVVDQVLPMRDAAEAHRVVEASTHVGKVLLTLR